MFSTDDTIAAIATAAGRGGIGIVRLSGPCAHRIARALLGGREQPLEPRHATFGRICRTRETETRPAEPVAFDQVVCTFFPRPHSYTGDDVVEIGAHGSGFVLGEIVAEAVRHGARLARPGEFTLRGYLNGRLDLVQAEAVADLVDAVTPAQARLAFDQLEGTLTGAIRELEHTVFELTIGLEASLDFPDEDYHFVRREAVAETLEGVLARLNGLLAGATAGRLIREGAQVVIAGRPNVGKSSLFNALLGAGRAIVTTVPGTTRDLLTERCDIEGVPITLVDTAGLRDVDEEVEREGVARAREAMRAADLCVLVLDRSQPLAGQDASLLEAASRFRHVVAASKTDLPASWDPGGLGSAGDGPIVAVSAHSGAGLTELRSALVRELGSSERSRDTPAISNLRHIALFEEAKVVIDRARAAVAAGSSEEFVLADLREAILLFDQIVGKRTPDDILDAIFSRFCIGK